MSKKYKARPVSDIPGCHWYVNKGNGNSCLFETKERAEKYAAALNNEKHGILKWFLGSDGWEDSKEGMRLFDTKENAEQHIDNLIKGGKLNGDYFIEPYDRWWIITKETKGTEISKKYSVKYIDEWWVIMKGENYADVLPFKTKEDAENHVAMLNDGINPEASILIDTQGDRYVFTGRDESGHFRIMKIKDMK